MRFTFSILRTGIALLLVVLMSMPMLVMAASHVPPASPNAQEHANDNAAFKSPQKILKKTVKKNAKKSVKKTVKKNVKKKMVKKAIKKKAKKTIKIQQNIVPVVPAPQTPIADPTVTPIPATAVVNIQSFAFAPGTLTVKKGTTVTFTNKDSAPHTVTAVTSEFGSDTLTMNQSFTFTFNTVGSFEYFCALHASMRGTITVTE